MSTRSQRIALRRGRGVLVKVLIGLVVCSMVGFLFVRTSNNSDETGFEDDPTALLVHTVQRQDFESFVTESGDIESSSNVEIRCEVKSEGGAARTTILEIVDAGTVVKKGDFLVTFDDSALQQRLTEQEIQVATDQAVVIGAQSELDKAVNTLNEYKYGLFLVDKETFESELFQAESQLKITQDTLAHFQRMFEKGYVTRIQLEATNLEFEMARKAAQAAKTKLKVLNEFTLRKMVHEYEADIEKQKAYLTAAQYTVKLSQQRRDDLLEQISKCRCVAPVAGQVVYANDLDKSDNIVIEEGAQIRERQVVIRLPDPKEMQVLTRINDSKIKQVQVGNPVTIEVDVHPDLPVRGVVSKIDPFPYPRKWYGGPIEYGAEIRIVDPPTELTPGQRTKVKIFVDRQDDVVQVPIQSIVERAGSHYCLVRTTEGSWMTRQISIGSNNGSFVVVRDGVDVGEQVALNPDLLWDNVVGDIPDAGDEDHRPSMVADVEVSGS